MQHRREQSGGLSRKDVFLPCAAASGAAWLTVIANYLQHALYRLKPWPAEISCMAHLLLGLQLASFVLVVRTPPGSPPQQWIEKAERGLYEDAVRDSKTGALVPPRARYVSRASQVVLHFDHFCWFLGVPIGLRNRKFFLLFLCYSLGLVLLALALDFTDLHAIASDAHLDATEAKRIHSHTSPPPSQSHTSHGAPRHHLRHAAELEPRLAAGGVPLPSLDLVFSAAWVTLCESWAGARVALGAWYLWYLAWLLPIDLFFLAFLSDLAYGSLSLALRGRTSLDPEDARYDYGCLRNLRDVLGERMLLWALPWPDTGSSRDGLHWRRGPANADQHHRPWTRSLTWQLQVDSAAKAV